MSEAMAALFHRPKPSTTSSSTGPGRIGSSASFPNLITQQPLQRPSMTTSLATRAAVSQADIQVVSPTNVRATGTANATTTTTTSGKSSTAISPAKNSAATQLLTRVSEEIKQRPWRPLPDRRLQVRPFFSFFHVCHGALVCLTLPRGHLLTDQSDKPNNFSKGAC